MGQRFVVSSNRSCLVDAGGEEVGLALEVFADQAEAVDAAVEPFGEACEQGRLFGIFFEVELADDVVALLADGDEFFKALLAAAAAPGIHRLGVHAGDEEGVVADVLADGALGVEGGGGAVNGVGGADEVFEGLERSAVFIAHFVELV